MVSGRPPRSRVIPPRLHLGSPLPAPAQSIMGRGTSPGGRDPRRARAGGGHRIGTGCLLQAATRRVALWRACDRRRVRPGGLGPRRLAQRRGPLRRRRGPVLPGLPAPQGLGRHPHRGFGVRPRRPRGGGRARRRRAGRRDQRGQHQHPDRAHRAGDLQDPQRGGPDLRPPPGRDLPAPRHPHRGHRDVDHRPGPAAPADRRGRARLVRPDGAPHPHRALAPRGLGGPVAARPRAAGTPQPGRRHPRRRAEGRCPRARRPGGRHPAPRGARRGVARRWTGRSPPARAGPGSAAS